MEENLKEFAERARLAFRNRSFDSDRRGDSFITCYEYNLAQDLLHVPETEKAAYVQKYKSLIAGLISSSSRVANPMITGSANFPVARNRKAMAAEIRKYEEFNEYRERAKKAYKKLIESRIPVEEKNAKMIANIILDIEDTIGSVLNTSLSVSRPLLASNLYNRLHTIAKNGNVEAIEAALKRIAELDKTNKFVSSRHKIFTLKDTAVNAAAKAAAKASLENKEETVNGVRVVHNYAIDRLQLYFNEKPPVTTLKLLKESAFRFAKNGCWQRQLTGNAIYAAFYILKNKKDE